MTDVSNTERHMFVSLATLSSQPSAIIGSLAFIVLNPWVDQPPDSHYFKTVDWDQEGRSYRFGSIQTMLGQSALARKAVSDQTPPVQLADALNRLVQAYKASGCTVLWAGAQDLAILRNALESLKIDIPWAYEDQRDITGVWATMMDLGLAPKIERGITEPENVPLGDAAFIARGVATIYRGFRADSGAGEITHTKEVAP
jgi:hypothetical protein